MSRLNVEKLIKFVNENFKICISSITNNIDINDFQQIKSFSSNIDSILGKHITKMKRFGSLHNYLYNENTINISLLYSIIFLTEYEVINSSPNREEFAINKIMILMLNFLKDTTNDTIQLLTCNIKKNIWIIDLINDKIRLFYDDKSFDVSKDNIILLYTGECFYEPIVYNDNPIINGSDELIRRIIDDEDNFRIYGKNKFITSDGMVGSKIDDIFFKSSDEVIQQSEVVDDFNIKTTKKVSITMKLNELQKIATELKIELKDLNGKRKTKSQLTKEINECVI
jgi:hypothetical protein